MTGTPATAPPARRRRAGARVAALVLLVAGLCAAAVPGVAATGSRAPAGSPAPDAFFGLGPSTATKLDGRPYFAWGVTPRGVLRDHVEIEDFGAIPVTLQVFVTNAQNIPQGGVELQTQHSVTGAPADWIRLDLPHGSSTVHLAARSSLVIPLTLRVPANASPGDYVGAVVASLTSAVVSKQHARVKFVQQVATRALIRVAGTLRPRLVVSGLHVSFHVGLGPTASGTATLRYTVRNTGNVLLGAHQTASVHGLFGSIEHSGTLAQVPVLLPGGSVRETAVVHGVFPEFLLHASVTVTPLAVAGQVDPALRASTTSVVFWAVPWLLVVLVVVLLAGAGGLYGRRRRRRAAGQAGPQPEEPAATGVER